MPDLFDAPGVLKAAKEMVAVYPTAAFNFEELCRINRLDPRESCNMAHPAHRALVEYRRGLGEVIEEFRQPPEWRDDFGPVDYL